MSDDNVAIIGDWVPPSPSSRPCFSELLGDNINSTTAQETPKENRTEELFPGSQNQATDRDAETNGVAQSGGSQFADHKSSLSERIAARAGFNAPRLNTENIRSAELSSSAGAPYLTIPPGLSPTTLLDSPVFLSNSLAQPSPTTGKFSFMPNANVRSLGLGSESADKSKDNFFEDINGSFAFKPIPDSRSTFFFGASKQSFPSIEVSVQSGNSEPIEAQPQNRNSNFHFTEDFLRSKFEKNEHSPPLEEPIEEGDQRANGALAEDGYNWRKYGQKQVKGSEYPRSYYKCTQLNCPVKKKVERSHEGHITEIIYKGVHNHPKPTPNRRSAIGPSADTQLSVADQVGNQSCVDDDPVWAGAPRGTPEWRDNVEVTSATAGPEFVSGDAVDASSTFSNEADEDDQATHGSGGYDGEGDESESKRRKMETYPADISGATRAIREPRVVVQTTSEVDILDDGYRWRKYGQKVVKGNPNPRSYYKCTNAGCSVRKHVERASHDLKSVITTYEGKHNHDVPAARNSSHVNSGASNNGNMQAGMAIHRPEPAQLHNSVPRFERPGAYGSYGLPGRQQLGVAPGFTFGMNQPGLANLAMAGLGPGQPKVPMMPAHSYLGQQRVTSEMGFVFPKGELKMEPLSGPSLNLPNNGSVYQQIMSRLPLEPQM